MKHEIKKKKLKDTKEMSFGCRDLYTFGAELTYYYLVAVVQRRKSLPSRKDCNLS